MDYDRVLTLMKVAHLATNWPDLAKLGNAAMLELKKLQATLEPKAVPAPTADVPETEPAKGTSAATGLTRRSLT